MSRFDRKINETFGGRKNNSYRPLDSRAKYAGAKDINGVDMDPVVQQNTDDAASIDSSSKPPKQVYGKAPGAIDTYSKWAGSGCGIMYVLIMTGVAITGLILASIAVSRIDEDNSATKAIYHEIINHRNATLDAVRYLATILTLNDLHTQEFLCAILVTECFDLQTQAAPAQIGYGALGHICKQIEETCAGIITNRVSLLNQYGVPPGSDYHIFDDITLPVPSQFVFGGGSLNGIRFDRLGPSSAQFGGLVQDIEKPLFDKNEYGMFISFSYTDVPGAGSLTDGLCWINLAVQTDNFATCTVVLDTGAQAGIYNIFSTQDRVFAIGTQSNTIHWWDTTTSVALANTGTTITSANIIAGTYVLVNDTSLSSPWHMEQLANGNYLVSMLDSTAPNCTSATPYLCGGFMHIDATLLETNVPASISRWDSLTDGFAVTRETPGEFALGDGVRRAVVSGSFGSWTHLINPDCFDFTTQITGSQTWGRQYNIFNSNNGEGVKQLSTAWSDIGDSIPLRDPRPFIEWRNISGFIPNVVRSYHRSNNQYLIADTVGGSIISVSYEGGSAVDPWSQIILAWVLPYINPSAPLDTNEWRSPLITDMTISNDDRYLYVASYGLGQISVYLLGDSGDNLLGNGIPQLCATYQITGGQDIFGGIFRHSADPSVPLEGAPASLSLEPNGKFLYVSTSHPFDKCVYPNAINSGGFVFRFVVHSNVCNSQSLNIDPSFLLRGKDLPGGRQGFPAKMGKMAFPAGDSKFKRVVRRLGGSP